MLGVLASYLCQFETARIVGEKGVSSEKMPPSDQTVGELVGLVGGIIPVLAVWDL